jgi:hypothetical protein
LNCLSDKKYDLNQGDVKRVEEKITVFASSMSSEQTKHRRITDEQQIMCSVFLTETETHSNTIK